MRDPQAYLERIGVDGRPEADLDGLRSLMYAHLVRVPFENLDIVAGVPVRTDLDWSWTKVVGGRGGWCFELNGAFAELLRLLGFDVRLLGAAVLLGGPNAVIDHLTIEVLLDQPYLVDVGFGAGFTTPLRLNDPAPQDGGAAVYQFHPSPQGTTLTHLDDGVPVAEYRFKRVDRVLADFDPASEHLRTDPTLHWSTKPFATRLLGTGADRVTLTRDRLKLEQGGVATETAVAADEWDAVLAEWFGISTRPRSR